MNTERTRGPSGIRDALKTVERVHLAAERADRLEAPEPVREPYREPGWEDLPPEPRTEGWRSELPSRLRWAQVEDFTGTVATALAEWSVNAAGRNLILTGPVGVGKSHAAVAACRRSAEVGLEVVFLPAVELFELLRPQGPPGLLWDLMDVDRLIIDDVGAERPTDWSIDRLYALINRRWLEERPTIITTNLDPREPLEMAVRADTYSRLVGSEAVVVKLSGQDRRRAR